MFKCDVGQHISEPRQKLTLITTETREKTYYNIVKGYHTQHGSKGTEIVKQVRCCPMCLLVLQQQKYQPSYVS